MVRSYKKKIKPWNDVTIDVAIQEIIGGAKIKYTAEKYGMSVGLLWNKLQQHKKGETKENEKRVRIDSFICIVNLRLLYIINENICSHLK